MRIKGEGVTIYGNSGPSWLYMEPNQESWRINVPIRYPDNRAAIWEALETGKGVDSVSSDHVISWAPNHRRDMFDDNIWKLRTGFTSRVEMLVPVVLSYGVNEGRITLERAVEVLCENPAKIFGIFPKKGTIQVGADADFCFVDMDREVTVSADNVTSDSGWSVVENHTFKGWPVRTILRGKTIAHWKEEGAGPEVVATEDTHGVYLPRVDGAKNYPL
jgi:dihydropyrimidinase/dihydroorotase